MFTHSWEEHFSFLFRLRRETTTESSSTTATTTRAGRVRWGSVSVATSATRGPMVFVAAILGSVVLRLVILAISWPIIIILWLAAALRDVWVQLACFTHSRFGRVFFRKEFEILVKRVVPLLIFTQWRGNVASGALRWFASKNLLFLPQCRKKYGKITRTIGWFGLLK